MGACHGFACAVQNAMTVVAGASTSVEGVTTIGTGIGTMTAGGPLAAGEARSPPSSWGACSLQRANPAAKPIAIDASLRCTVPCHAWPRLRFAVVDASMCCSRQAWRRLMTRGG
jgi:hypothetical protein